jgi:outer membrane autotransporter protein
VPPVPPVPPGPEFPIIGPELATYGVVQPVARQLGLTTLGTLHERFGDSLEPCTPGAAVAAPRAPAAPDCGSGMWGRVFGQQIDNRYSAFADPRASGQLVGIQTGFDFWRGSLMGGRDASGLYFAYGNSRVDVDGLVTNQEATAFVLGHTGTVNLNGYSLGGYWTHYGPTGWYVDAVVQGTFYEGDATTQFANLPLDGGGIITSLEAGYPFPLPWFGPSFVLEPQGQIIWQQVSFKEANDGLGPVGLGTTSGATGRLGLRGKWTIASANGVLWQPYVVANVWRDWGAEATTMFGIDPVPLLERATRLEFAGGMTAKLGAKWSVFAQGGFQFATSDNGRQRHPPRRHQRRLRREVHLVSAIRRRNMS